MTLWKEYHTPTSVDEALALLMRYGGRARIVAGGTDLILDMQSGQTAPVQALVDVTKITDLDHIEWTSDNHGDWIVLGANVTHAQIEENPLLQRVATCLSESCRVVGGPQVRNVATLGGNVAHALPAADGTIGLLALNAQVQVATWQAETLSTEWQPLATVFAGPGHNTLALNQMLSRFRFRPTGRHQGSAFDRIMRPQGIALPILGVAARVGLDEHLRRIVDVTIAMGPAGPVPFRASDAEAVLLAADCFDADALEAAIAAAREQAQLRTSKYRATKEYRHEMVGVLLRRVLQRAFDDAVHSYPEYESA